MIHLIEPKALFMNNSYYKLQTLLIFWLVFGPTNIQVISAQQSEIKKRQEISQYGITWTFEEPTTTGQFITGDWWVIGPVKIVEVTPAPGPVKNDFTKIQINHWGDTSMKIDTSMRNGSMIVVKVGYTEGYDSRNHSYKKDDSVVFPVELIPNHTLLSSISNPSLPVENFCKSIMMESEKKSRVTLKTIAVLTCLAEIPPNDAFRPPYAGIDKPIFRKNEIEWDVLPKLEPVGNVPSWDEFERYFQRPWIDHLMSWEQQELVPYENGPNYGREHARIVSMASLMLMLDVPKEKKEKLTIGLIQRGIDLYGLAINGGYWNEGGGHSSGRKWPILFASIMLDKPELTNLPPTAIFQEDTQTYYGKGWFGQTALWQMIIHHGRRDPYEEKSPKKWENWDKTSEDYRICCTSSAWIGTTLAARYLKAIKLWRHDAYFDYIDRWMREDDPYKEARGEHSRPIQETEAFDPFVTAMWRAYRKTAPVQGMSGRDMKFVWEEREGKWIPNPKQ